MWHFFPPILQKIIKMSVPRERGTLFFCLFWFNKTGATFQKYGNSSGNSLFLSLSLSGFCCRFSSNSSHPGKRQTERQTDRQTYVSVSLSVSFVWYLKTRIWCRLFPERELRPPSNYYPIIGGEDQKNRQTDRQTDVCPLSLSVCLSRSFDISRREFDVAFFQERIETPPIIIQ